MPTQLRTPTFTPEHFRQVVRAGALYDFIVTAPFATPWSFAWLHAGLSQLNVQLGGEPLPDFAVLHTLLACLLGSVVTVWATLRWMRPETLLGRYDAAARLLFTSWMVWALAHGGPPLVWLFVVPEALWAVLQAWPVAVPAGPQLAGRTLRATG